MKIFKRNIILAILVSLSITSYAQYDFRSDWEKDGLKGRVKKIVVQKKIMDRLQPAETRVYNSNGYLEYVSDDAHRNNPDFPGGTLKAYSYDNQGRIVSYRSSYEDGRVCDMTKYVYGDMGLLEQQNTLIEGKESHTKTTYEYFPDGNVASSTFTTPNGDMMYKAQDKYQYENDRLVRIETYVNDTHLAQRVFFDGSIQRPIEYAKYKKSGRVVSGRYFYDADGHEIRWELKENDGKWRVERTREYDANGALLKEVSYADNGDVFMTTVYENDSHGNWIKSQENVVNDDNTYEEVRDIEYYP